MGDIYSEIPDFCYFFSVLWSFFWIFSAFGANLGQILARFGINPPQNRKFLAFFARSNPALGAVPSPARREEVAPAVTGGLFPIPRVPRSFFRAPARL